jgi:predicted nuclease with TOPRIM domain
MPFENTVLVLGSFLAGFLLHILLMRQKKRKLDPKKHLANIQFADQFLESVKQIEFEKFKYNSYQQQIALLENAKVELAHQSENTATVLERSALEETALSSSQATTTRIKSRLNTLKPVTQRENEQVGHANNELENLNSEFLRQRTNNLAAIEDGKKRQKDFEYETRKLDREIKRLEESCATSTHFLDQFNEELSRSEIDQICMKIDSSGLLKKKFFDLLKLIISEGDPVKIESDKARIKKILHDSLKKL